MGIAECNMMGYAAGYAASGAVVFASTFAAFAAGRAYDQIRNSIAYPNLNVKIAKGEKVAIVGVNGAGKTTFVKLLTGLFTVTEGAILVNGIDIREFNPDQYQEMFSAVYQEVKIYAATILENVTGGGKDRGKSKERQTVSGSGRAERND